jgi:NAD(P)-dependent dehydrogenase (short-subunit alcohol dehydrogenase family)
VQTSSINQFRLDGKVSIVTGATGHLGKAISIGLAEAGSRVAVCSRSAEEAQRFARELEQMCGVETHGFGADLSKSEEMRSLFDEVGNHFGRLDCLVNNAYFGASNALEKITFDEWTRGLHGTASVAFFALQTALPWLENARGTVINISSMYGVVSPDPALYSDTPFGNPVNYGAGKAALLQLTRYAAVHLAPKGIRVNAISPGPFPSPEVQKNALFTQRLADRVPLKRVGHPDELKGVVVFLASDASSYITGQNLMVDGGWTIW